MTTEELSLLQEILHKAIGERTPEERERLSEILGKLKTVLDINEHLEPLLELMKRMDEKIDRIAVPARVLILPVHLRPAMRALHMLGEASATQVCERTGRSRSTESSALNQLARMGYVEKRKVGKTAYFSPVDRS